MKKIWILLTVVLIVGVTAPLIVCHVKQTREQNCYHNLVVIDAGIVSVALAKGWASEGPIKEDIVRSYLPGKVFICPSGGKYIMPRGVAAGWPKCSFHGSLIDKIGLPANMIQAEGRDKRGIAQPSPVDADATRAAPEK